MMTATTPRIDELLKDPLLSAECRTVLADARPLIECSDPAHQLKLRDDRLVADLACCALDPGSERAQNLKAALAKLLPRVAALPELQQREGGDQHPDLRPILQRLCQQVGSLPKELWSRDDLLGPKAAGRPLRRYLMADQPRSAIGQRGLLERNYQKVQFAAQAGLGGLQPAGEGHNGACFAWKSGHRLCAVYKPGWAKMPLASRVSNAVKTLCGGQLSKLPYGPIKQPQAERASYLHDRFHGFNVVPASMLLDDGGCFQLSLYKHLKHKHGLATSQGLDVRRGDQTEELLNRDHYGLDELEAWQDFCVEDYGIGNLDAAPDNFFLYLDEQEKILDIVGIDKGHSHPIKDAWSGSLADHHRYLWGRKYRISTIPFVQSVRERMRLCAERFDDYWRLLEEDRELEGFCEPASKALGRLRSQVLGQAADDPAMSPAKLSQLRSESQMRAYLTQ